MWPKRMFAEDIKANEIKWRALANIPEPAPGLKQPGLAGAFAGFHEGVLMIAGGANFPIRCPGKGDVRRIMMRFTF